MIDVDVATVVGLLALAAAAGMSVQQWRAHPAAPGFLAGATRVVTGPSTRTTVAFAVTAGMIGAQWGADRLVEGTAWLAGITGLDAAAWAPAGADLVVLVVLAVCVIDVVVIGLCGIDPGWLKALLRRLRLPPLLDPALRHTILGVGLFPVLVAGVPLLAQTGSDAIDTVGGAPQSVACAPANLAGPTVAGFGPDRLIHAAVIVQVGKDMGVPERGQIIAVATAIQESGLDPTATGDGGKAFGAFQQHPHYGTETQRRDVAVAARAFYTRLLKVRDYQDRPLWQAAQAVQRSADGTLYAKREAAAAQIVGVVDGTTCTTETRS